MHTNNHVRVFYVLLQGQEGHDLRQKGDYVNVYSLADEQGCRYAHTVYFDKVREGVYYGFIRGRKKEYVHFNLIYIQSLTRVPEPCA